MLRCDVLHCIALNCMTLRYINKCMVYVCYYELHLANFFYNDYSYELPCVPLVYLVALYNHVEYIHLVIVAFHCPR